MSTDSTALSTMTAAQSTTHPLPAPFIADLFAFLQELPLGFVIGFLTVGMILVSRYLLPK